MAQIFQITPNEVLSGVSKSIYKVFGDALNIYKNKEQYLDLPAVTLQCINYEKVTERYDRFTNTFNVIINYFDTDNNIISNNRTEMFNHVEKIIDAVRYIELPAYQKDQDGNLVETVLLNRGHDISSKEQENFMQIAVTYTVRTKLHTPEAKMQQLEIDVITKNTGG